MGCCGTLFTHLTTHFRFAKTTRTPTSPSTTRQVFPPDWAFHRCSRAGSSFYSVAGPPHLLDSLWIGPYLTRVVNVGLNTTRPPPHLSSPHVLWHTRSPPYHPDTTRVSRHRNITAIRGWCRVHRQYPVAFPAPSGSSFERERRWLTYANKCKFRVRGICPAFNW